MKIAVLGSGPAGIVAAHAATLALGKDLYTQDLQIITNNPMPSDLYGAQYLHEPIIGVPNVLRSRVKYELRGSAANYRNKVYGPDFFGSVSPEDLAEEHDAWDLRQTYLHLWTKYQHLLQPYYLTPGDMSAVLKEFDCVINSIPASRLCLRSHSFNAQLIYAAGEAPEIGRSLPYGCPGFTVICNALPEPAWYRISNIFGRKTVEWPGHVRPPVFGAVAVNKPLTTNCDCWTDTHVLRVGRYGRWEKGVLVHDAFNATYDWIRERVC